jgi:chromosome-anchoring protein RacA
MMNTGAVAKELGVSSSTVQRWVTGLNMEIERNELGHYLFTSEDLAQLREIQQKLSSGLLLQQIIQNERITRKGTALRSEKELPDDDVLKKIKDLERRLEEKADAVVSYQLLQHRQEMDDMQKQIICLTERIDALEANNMIKKDDTPIGLDSKKPVTSKPKKKHFFQSLFEF